MEMIIEITVKDKDNDLIVKGEAFGFEQAEYELGKLERFCKTRTDEELKQIAKVNKL